MDVKRRPSSRTINSSRSAAVSLSGPFRLDLERFPVALDHVQKVVVRSDEAHEKIPELIHEGPIELLMS